VWVTCTVAFGWLQVVGRQPETCRGSRHHKVIVKLNVYWVGYVIVIHNDTRSTKRQISLNNFEFLFNLAMCLEPSRPKHNKHVNLPHPFLNSFNVDTPASKHSIPLISILVHSIHCLAAQLKSIARFKIKSHFSDSFTTTFSLNMQGKWHCTYHFMCNRLDVHWKCGMLLQVPTCSNYSYY
jgi:hypothetical protein